MLGTPLKSYFHTPNHKPQIDMHPSYPCVYTLYGFSFIALRLFKYVFYICSLLSSLNKPRFICADSGSSS